MKKDIATISRTNEILSKYELFAKKNYGQNFLVEPRIVENIANAAISSCEYEKIAAIEIGPGIGALTQQLAKRADKVLAFEIDNRLIPVLEKELDEFNNIEVINNDFLQINIKEYIDNLCNDGYKVVIAANLPYYITTPILFKLFESKANIQSITVMMQKEVGDRFAAKVSTKEYNALTIISNYICDIKTVLKVPNTVFNPKPKVDSCVLQFKLRDIDKSIDNEKLFSLIKVCFTQRRKTILNNLKELNLDKEQIEEILNKSNIKSNVRSETLIIDDFIRLYEALYGN